MGRTAEISPSTIKYVYIYSSVDVPNNSWKDPQMQTLAVLFFLEGMDPWSHTSPIIQSSLVYCNCFAWALSSPSLGLSHGCYDISWAYLITSIFLGLWLLHLRQPCDIRRTPEKIRWNPNAVNIVFQITPDWVEHLSLGDQLDIAI